MVLISAVKMAKNGKNVGLNQDSNQVLYHVSCGRVVHDLGDCCLFEPGEMCGDQCICYQNEEETTMTATSSNCISDWIGDGFCDDENNYSWCQYDNGDCCHLETAYENANEFCNECLCKSNETNYPISFVNK